MLVNITIIIVLVILGGIFPKLWEQNKKTDNNLVKDFVFCV